MTVRIGSNQINDLNSGSPIHSASSSEQIETMCDVKESNAATIVNDDDSAANGVEQLSASALAALKRMAREHAILDYNLKTEPVSHVGENSYGLVVRVTLQPTRTLPTFAPVPPFVCILKIAPKNAARRSHMKVAEYYDREVFMYTAVLNAFQRLQRELGLPAAVQFDAAPEMFCHSLTEMDEFIVLEDLRKQNYVQNAKAATLTFELVACALRVLAQFHAMSFVLASKEPHTFATLTVGMTDNLFTPDIDQVSIEFGKKYVRRTRTMLEEDLEVGQALDVASSKKQIELLQHIEDNFKDICLKAVAGRDCAPYAVICHGDFWNNNILYKYDSTNSAAIRAKLIDFQMSRYAAPVLDVIHYLFACTEKPLRDAHFHDFLAVYYEALANQLVCYDLKPTLVYPRDIFEQQLRSYGVYGFCMAAFAVPFLIANTSEFPDLDKVSEAIGDLTSGNAGDQHTNELEKAETEASKREELLNEWDLLTARTVPIFKQRMTGIVADLLQYGMDGFCQL